MLDPTGVICRSFLVYAEFHEKPGKNDMAFIDTPGLFLACFCQLDIAGIIYPNKSFLFSAN